MDPHTLSESLISLATLSLLEIVLGIDNIVVISILSEKLPPHQKSKARKWGLSLALITRVALLTTLTWLSRLTQTLFTIADRDISVRDLVLFTGGVFLLWKATKEIYKYAQAQDVEEEKDFETRHFASSFVAVVGMIIFFDIVFSFDSVLTAIGLAKQLWIMILAVVLAIIFMLIFVDRVSDFIEKNPTIKVLALAFLVVIGALLILEGIHVHIDRNLIYFAMAFSISVEFLSIRRRMKIQKLKNKSFHSES